MLRHQSIIDQMSLDEKIKLCSGASFWTTEAMDRLGIPSLFMCDGPHGLRKQEAAGDHLGLSASVASTCFPSASAVAATWDVDLVREMGEALGAEAVQEGVNIILGPGVNMKRNPLCGRNFDPGSWLPPGLAASRAVARKAEFRPLRPSPEGLGSGGRGVRPGGRCQQC